jgi:hypothetical protein
VQARSDEFAGMSTVTLQTSTWRTADAVSARIDVTRILPAAANAFASGVDGVISTGGTIHYIVSDFDDYDAEIDTSAVLGAVDPTVAVIPGEVLTVAIVDPGSGLPNGLPGKLTITNRTTGEVVVKQDWEDYYNGKPILKFEDPPIPAIYHQAYTVLSDVPFNLATDRTIVRAFLIDATGDVLSARAQARAWLTTVSARIQHTVKLASPAWIGECRKVEVA